MSLHKAFIGACVALAAAGCATTDFPQRDNLRDADPAVQACAQWYQSLDEAIDRAGVRDAEARRIPGFPYVRVDRLTAALAPRAQSAPAAFDAWVARMARLDAQARRHEIANLPAGLRPGPADAAVQRAAECARQLSMQDLAGDAGRRALLERARVPDDYLAWQRAVGLYPLTRVPFSFGVQRWHEEAADEFRRAGEGTLKRAVQRYAPRGSAGLQREEVAAILARSTRDALGVPEPAGADLERLFDAFAPVFEVETTGTFDHPGALRLAADGTPGLDTSRPVVYRRIGHTMVEGRPLLQLVYTIWFPERPRAAGFDILGGPLDGIVFRVTLAPDGEPVVYDSIHPCGCYHMFFPTPRAAALPPPDPGDEWMFAPRTLPRIAADERIVVRIASRTHYLYDVAPDRGTGGARYELADEDALRELPLPGGGSHSLYGPDGLVEASARPERLLFWPMGVPSAGTMRQWGHHATAFLGRRHFDDADLIERRFRILAP